MKEKKIENKRMKNWLRLIETYGVHESNWAEKYLFDYQELKVWLSDLKKEVKPNEIEVRLLATWKEESEMDGWLARCKKEDFYPESLYKKAEEHGAMVESIMQSNIRLHQTFQTSEVQVENGKNEAREEGRMIDEIKKLFAELFPKQVRKRSLSLTFALTFFAFIFSWNFLTPLVEANMSSLNVTVAIQEPAADELGSGSLDEIWGFSNMNFVFEL